MNRSYSIVLSALALLAFFLWGIHYADTNLWWDEIISLTEYSLVDIQTTLTAYPDPNNHILFNLLQNVLTWIWGQRDVYVLMDEVAPLRWIQWVIGLGTLIYVFVTGRRFFGRTAGAMGALFLATCLPFLNFSMQLRGYNLSLFLAAGLLYHTWSSLESRSTKHTILVGLYSFGLLYTMPSNVYFLIALGLFVLWRGVIQIRRSSGADAVEDARDPLLLRPESRILLAVGLGTLLAVLAYIPVMDGLLHNRFVTARPPERGFILTERLPEVLNHLLSYRYLLLLVALPGLYKALRDVTRRLRGSDKALPMLAVLLLPFIFSFLRNDHAFQRTFIHLAPLFALILAAGCWWTVQSWRTSFVRTWLVPFLCVYAMGSLVFAHLDVQDRLKDDLGRNVREQNIFANYYQSTGFHPLETSGIVARAHSERPGPVILADELDRVAWSFYLQKFGITCYALVRLQAEPHERQDTQYTHIGLFQKSQGRGKDLAFFQSSLRLPRPRAEDRLTPVLKIAQSYEHAERYYLITAFADKNRDLLREEHPSLRVEPLDEAQGFGSVFVLSETGI